MTSHQELVESMREFSTRMTRALNNVMKAHGASLAQIKLLTFIQQGDLVRATDIGDAFGYAPRTVTMAIDGLERDGLVRREAIQNDRRVKRIRLTDKGHAAIRDVEPASSAFLETLFDVLDDAEEAEWLRLLEKLTGRLQDVSPPGSGGSSAS